MRKSHYEAHHRRTPIELLKNAHDLLCGARDEVKEAKAPRTLAKIRRALKSLGGAIRHAELAPQRAARQASKSKSPSAPVPKPKPWYETLLDAVERGDDETPC